MGMGMRTEMGMSIGTERRWGWKGERERKGNGMRMRPSSPTLLGQAELPGLPPARRLAQLRAMMEKRGWGTFCCREGERMCS